MSLRYRSVGNVKVQDLGPDPNRLYWILDGMADSAGKFVVFEALDEPERFIQALSLGDRKFDVEWRANSESRIFSISAADILVAQQSVLRCMQRAEGWESVGQDVLSRLDSSVLGADGLVDYGQTGLSIANSFLDYSKRMKRLGMRVETPPTLKFGEFVVATGDVWSGLPDGVSLAIRVDKEGSSFRQGISISSSHPVLSSGDRFNQREVIFWPGSTDLEVLLQVGTPGGDVRVTTVYEVGGENWSRVERWTENSGFWVERLSPKLSRYHSNYFSVYPATFDDTVFEVEIISGG